MGRNYGVISIILTLLFFIMFLICVSFNKVFIIIIPIIITAEILFIYLVLRRSYLAYLYIIIFILFQNLILVSLSKYINKTMFNAIIINKEIIVYVTVSVFLLKLFLENRLTKVDIVAMFGLIVLTIYLFCFSKNSFMAAFASYRQLIIPFALYLYGKIIIIDYHKFLKVNKIYVFLFLFTIIWGLLEIIIGDRLWISLGIKEYLVHKDAVRRHFYTIGVPGSFYTYDFYFVLGKPLRRMASTLVDPVIYSHLVAYVALVFIFCKELFRNYRYRKIGIMLSVISLILTFGKGGIITFLFGILFYFNDIKKNKILTKLLLISSILVAILLIGYGQKVDNSLTKHWNGLVDNLKYIVQKPLGNGIGTNGNFADLYGDEDFESTGAGESFIGKVIVETGIIGLTIYCIFFILMYREIRRIKFNKLWLEKNRVIILGCITGTIVSSILSVSAISFTANAYLFITAGIIVANKNKLRMEENYGKEESKRIR